MSINFRTDAKGPDNSAGTWFVIQGNYSTTIVTAKVCAGSTPVSQERA